MRRPPTSRYASTASAPRPGATATSHQASACTCEAPLNHSCWRRSSRAACPTSRHGAISRSTLSGPAAHSRLLCYTSVTLHPHASKSGNTHRKRAQQETQALVDTVHLSIGLGSLIRVQQGEDDLQKAPALKIGNSFGLQEAGQGCTTNNIQPLEEGLPSLHGQPRPNRN